MEEQLEFVKLIASRLETAGIPYMLTGSVAMALYTVPRMTRDIDIVVALGPKDAPGIHNLFVSDCYVDEESVREAVARRGMFNIIHNDWMIKADFIVRKEETYRLVEFDRRRRFEIEGTNIFVVAPEDLILSKLIWSRESDSELQRRDAQAIAESVKDLEWPYLKQWAEVLHLEDMLEALRKT